ncbi:hypothetical protein CXU22_03465 [Akkermansia muciniphila]|uniref:Uncharacterized protein n=1 Tax=Akkermansia muciniphila TaxID=239935 RepID=A0A2N8HF07_9BACT|nr:hypothetical protein [Akkermansia muciniphila]PNC18867.1 hypothetical protein CXU22_03465 [Akkermansia muciniphila]
MKFRSLYAVIYVTAIGVILSFALSWGNKTEVNYYDFAELVTYNIDRDNRNDDARYKGISLDEKTRNELKTIMEDFELSNFCDNPFSLGSGQVIIYYYLIITIQNEPYILTIIDRGNIEKNSFDLDKIVNSDRKFYYTNIEEYPTASFKNRELSKRLDDFIRENKNIIDGKMSNIKQQQPKYSSPIIQWFHKHYSEAAVWTENRYYDFIDP